VRSREVQEKRGAAWRRIELASALRWARPAVVAVAVAVVEEAAMGMAVTEAAAMGMAVTEAAAMGMAVTEEAAMGVAVTEAAATGAAVLAPPRREQQV